MTAVLSGHQYGKAETHLVRIERDTPRHEIHDLNVTTALRGDFADAYLTGDQSKVLPTDTQKNSAYVWAKTHGIASAEDYGLALARHFVDDVEPVDGARIEIEQYAWERVVVDGREHDHSWIRSGREVRTAAITVDATGAHVIAGLKDLVLLKSTGSEFSGFLKDRYTTLGETDDRVMATSLVAKWRYAPDHTPADPAAWNDLYAEVRRLMVEQFATLHSLALQQTLWHMGTAVLEALPEIVEVRLSAPNKHHFLVDFTPFDVPNAGEVFHADDRPYGLIQAGIMREGAAEMPDAWLASAGLA
jgi:urate oxidase